MIIKTSLIRSIGYALGSVAYALSQWLILLAVTRLSGVSNAGEYSYYLAILSPFVILFNFGLRNAIASDDSSSRVFHKYLGSQFLGIVLFLLVYILLLLINRSSIQILTLVFLIKVIDMLSEVIYGYWISIRSGYRYGISKLLKLIVFIVIFTIGKYLDVSIQFLLYSFPLGMLIVFIFYDINYMPLKGKAFKRMQLDFSIVRTSLPLAFGALCISLLAYYPRFLLGYFDSSKALLAHYVFLIYFASIAAIPVSALSNTLIPEFRLANYRSMLLSSNFFILCLYSSVYMLFMVFLSIKVIEIMYGVSFYQDKKTLFIVSLSGVLMFFMTYFNAYLVSQRKFKRILFISIVNILLIALPMYFLIKKYLLQGAIYGLLLSTSIGLGLNIFLGIYKNERV